MSNITTSSIIRGFIKLIILLFWMFCLYTVYDMITDWHDLLEYYEPAKFYGVMYLVSVSCLVLPYVFFYWKPLNPGCITPKPVRALQEKGMQWKASHSPLYVIYTICKGIGIILGLIWLIGLGLGLLMVIIIGGAFALVSLSR